MRQGGKVSWLALLFLFCLPLTALADMGTPLMWTGLLHMVFGNALIGVGEGLVLWVLFRTNPWRCVILMIAANYFSGWFGEMFLLSWGLKWSDFDLYSAWHWIWTMVAVSFLLTCVFEWPFVFFCLPKSGGRWKRSVWSNLLVQSVSYALIFGWYWSASQKSLYTGMHIVKPAAFPTPKNAVLYFISTNASVYSMSLPNGITKEISSLTHTNVADRLILRKSGSGEFDLCAELMINYTNRDVQVVISNVNLAAAANYNDMIRFDNTGATGFGVARIGSDSNSVWEFRLNWSAGGLRSTNGQTGDSLNLAFETPFAQWTIWNVYQLPGDCIVFQLGSDQICILDPETRRLALLARGYGPVVVLE